MALEDFLNIPITLNTSGINTSLLKEGATLKVTYTGRTNNNVKRLGVEASGFDTAANNVWSSVGEAIYIDSEDSRGVVVGCLDDVDNNDGHTFMIRRERDKFRVIVNWRLKDGGTGGGPPEDSTG